MYETRGSYEPLNAHLGFNLTIAISFDSLLLTFEMYATMNGNHLGWRIEGLGVTHNFERGQSKDHF